MQCQIEQMKSSIRNIQRSLEKMERPDPSKLAQDTILPESLIHEHVEQAPVPTPKITCTYPNVTSTTVYSPARHHLDDTEMKRTLRHAGMGRGGKSGQSVSPRARVEYIYDGTRVIYMPADSNPFHEYGQILVAKGKENKRKEKSRNKERVEPQFLNRVKESAIRQKPNEISKTKKLKVKSTQMTMPIVQLVQAGHSESQHKPTQKTAKIQCNIGKPKAKPRFQVSWEPDTDSDFSQLSL